ncbi:undecaprenyl-phosphate galactose phosphotransferase WbaP [Desulfurobacterium indicum]|uniref:UDP-phosphate galactose phosphotransferase n=1 Tax=Desulfurobacterium indicum TaxID=1914305 RepID=A0A1R1MLS3_9BACT|nr:undecaprenyl-phosphate galactose phosphotransferase WbaP [Desulfurobacterium indicum]OMH40761.1 UDP-phosphate galactose phosphotransferase [Desulfurobacterium indicum]
MRKYVSFFLMLVSDLCIFYVSLFLAYLLRLWFGDKILPHYYMTFRKLLSLWWFPVAYIFSFWIQGLYTSRLPFWEEVKRIVKAVSFATVIILSVVSLGRLSEHVSRTTVLILWMISIPMFAVSRRFLKPLLYRLSLWKQEAIAVGNKEFINKIKEIFDKDHFMGYYISRGIEIPPFSFSYEKKLSELEADTLIVAIPDSFEGDTEKFLAKIHKSARNVLFIPDIKGLAFLNSELYPLFFSEIFLLSVKNNLKYFTNRFLKRLFDLTFSILLLPVLLPIIAIIAILIKLDSEGPVFFVHNRIGKDGKIIGVIKFRTMYKDAQQRLEKLLTENEEIRKEWETYFKLKNDPRITKVGKFLRKTSLDELPQIFNVLKGDMSFVGPRPVIKEEIEKYYKEFAQYYYLVKPGITGLWQVSGRSDTDYDKRVRLDTWYVLNWSLWLDIIILIKTIKAVLKREGAY